MNQAAISPPAGIVDVCAVHYDLAGWEAYLLGFAREAPGYLEKFGPRFCSLAGAELSIYRARLQQDPERAVLYLLEQGGAFNTSFEAYAAALERQNVRHAILQGCPWSHRDGRSLNDYLAACARRSPDRFSAWAGLSLRDPPASARELRRCVSELRMRGATLIPFWENVAASDPSCKPIYDAACELDVPVWIHAGFSFNARVGLDVSHWRHIDAVASAYPRLRILLGHGAWPWIAEAVCLCLRHENVYLEFSTHRPALMTRAGSGWEPLLFQAAGAMRERVLFGSASWVSPKSVADLAQETRALPISPEVAALWLGGNAQRALGLDVAMNGDIRKSL
jgi:hypothetical protein